MNRKKKVLHILYGGLGGHGNVFFSLVDGDESKEYDYVALFNGIEPIKDEYIQKCQRYEIPFGYVRKKRGLDLKFFLRVFRSISRIKPDIIFLHSPLCILPAFLYRAKRIGKSQVIVRETEPNHLKTKQDWFWLRMAMLTANRILFLSEQFRIDVARRLGWFFRKRKTGVIPNGIDLNLFRPSEKATLEKTQFVIGMQSRLENSKDHVTLIQAFANLKKEEYYPGLALKIAGDGSKREELKQLAKKLAVDDKMVLTGMLGEADLVAFLRSLDLYIHASKGEAMSTAIMQAMACRLPVIASDVMGINNMVTDGLGILVPVKNAEALAAAIDKVVRDTSLRQKLAEAAYKNAIEKFSNRRMFLHYRHIFSGNNS